MLLNILKIIMCLGTIGTGLLSLILPRSVQNFTGLTIAGPRGTSEVRAVLGGFFIALGLFPLLVDKPEAYRMLGFAYLAVGGVRAVSIVLDRSYARSNIISLIVEIVFGVILVL
jgi:hypothetical protein